MLPLPWKEGGNEEPKERGDEPPNTEEKRELLVSLGGKRKKGQSSGGVLGRSKKRGRGKRITRPSPKEKKGKDREGDKKLLQKKKRRGEGRFPLSIEKKKGIETSL